MFTIVLTLSAEFLAIAHMLASKLPRTPIDTNRAQELELRPGVTEAEARHLMDAYVASGRYDQVKLYRSWE